MTQPYPSDEFDRLDESTGRRGAHRARPSLLAAALPAALVAVVVVAVLVGVTTLLGSRPPQSAATAGFETPTTSETGSPTSEPSDTPSSEPTDGPTDEPSDTPTEEATEEPEAEVDRSAAVAVLNGTKTSGLAAQAARQLKNDGWNVVRTDNYRDRTVPTTVFYADSDLRPTAEAVAADLGGAHVEQNRAVTDSVTVVLGADYSG